MIHRGIIVALMCGMFLGCASSKPSYVNPGMSRQEVIRSLGPPLYVVAKEELGVEYLHYRLPPIEVEKGDAGDMLVDLVVPIHEGMVLSPDHPVAPD